MSDKRTPFNAEELEQIESMSAVGLNVTQMAALLGMSKKTFDRRISEDDTARDSIEKGRAKAIFQVGKTAYQQAISGLTPAMTMFYLKCRAGWKEARDDIQQTSEEKYEEKKKELQDLIDAIKRDLNN